MTPERKDKLTKVLNKRQGNLTVLLENVLDPHNISAIMRSCDSVGIQDIYVLNTIIPPHKKWSSRSSSSAAKWISVHQFADTETCIAYIRQRYDRIITTHLTENAQSLYDFDLTASTALVFGNERLGVSKGILEKADANMVIPQVGIISSLNISVACAVSLYEAFRQKQLAGHYANSNLNNQQRQLLKREWGM